MKLKWYKYVIKFSTIIIVVLTKSKCWSCLRVQDYLYLHFPLQIFVLNVDLVLALLVYKVESLSCYSLAPT